MIDFTNERIGTVDWEYRVKFVLPHRGTFAGHRGMRMVGLWLGLCAMGCSEPAPPNSLPTATAWTLTFTNQQSSMYGGSSCVGMMNYLYCKTWYDDKTSYAGTLTRNGNTWSLNAGSPSPYTTTSEDSSRLWLRYGPYCESYALEFAARGDSIAGTFIKQTDCHGAGSHGTFTGHR
jgi:hypothetical protein